ncbi:sulfotransferase family protein [Acetohalobium arabaticum]|uniref:Sulfotransferase n=1 Tax=Acetohalobium arabaticum (strain ATCC 49924 / DSM 5501 / Z-7288) TaxID=574087 RepID=D9QTB0_ACEAZ|nr:sulfotransferase family protein [Acetohalobium arabaticum]ADL13610.1 hypothetical protein Acear_2121 [Acetohalobium arabaticum DSM 5501]
MKKFLKEIFRDIIWKIKNHIRRRNALKSKSEDFFLNLEEKVLNEANCYFVLSTGRCGTLLLTKILNLDENSDVFHRPSPELVFPSTYAYKIGNDNPEKFKIASMCARYDHIENSFICDRNFVETNCRITFFAPFLAQVFKKSKFIHLVRSPISFIKSAVSRGFYQHPKADRGHITPKDDASISWDTMTPIEKSAWLWNETNSYIEDFKQEIDSSRYITIFSENLFTRPEEAEKSLSFLGNKSISKKQISKIIKKPVNKSKKSSLANNLNEEQIKNIEKYTSLAKLYNY